MFCLFRGWSIIVNTFCTQKGGSYWCQKPGTHRSFGTKINLTAPVGADVSTAISPPLSYCVLTGGRPPRQNTPAMAKSPDWEPVRQAAIQTGQMSAGFLLNQPMSPDICVLGLDRSNLSWNCPKFKTMYGAGCMYQVDRSTFWILHVIIASGRDSPVSTVCVDGGLTCGCSKEIHTV